jgi:hypothetical protein
MRGLAGVGYGIYYLDRMQTEKHCISQAVYYLE